ncbi:MAG: hypothetical protein LC722_01645 [Actinobacteria bacterium]|nr:hypothetical protein [Actinomycetota bacterium]
MAADADLRRRHRMEYERLSKKHEPVEALQKLVANHSPEYGRLVAAARDRLRAQGAA